MENYVAALSRDDLSMLEWKIINFKFPLFFEPTSTSTWLDMTLGAGDRDLVSALL